MRSCRAAERLAMTPGSLPPSSPRVRALLWAEREIFPQPELLRRRAELRARTALWYARELPGKRVGPIRWWKRLRLAAVALLCTTSAAAAWIALGPARHSDAGAAVRAPVVRRPLAPRVVLPSASSAKRLQTAPPDGASDSGLATVATLTGRAREERKHPAYRFSIQREGTSPDELALLDRGRRALEADDFRAALAVLEQHARMFPNSQLGEERQALRIRALEGAGFSKKADRAAQDFEARYPKSVLAPLLQKNE